MVGRSVVSVLNSINDNSIKNLINPKLRKSAVQHWSARPLIVARDKSCYSWYRSGSFETWQSLDGFEGEAPHGAPSTGSGIAADSIALPFLQQAYILSYVHNKYPKLRKEGRGNPFPRRSPTCETTGCNRNRYRAQLDTEVTRCHNTHQCSLEEVL